LTHEEKCLELMKNSSSGIILINKSEGPYEKVNVLEDGLGGKHNSFMTQKRRA